MIFFQAQLKFALVVSFAMVLSLPSLATPSQNQSPQNQSSQNQSSQSQPLQKQALLAAALSKSESAQIGYALGQDLAEGFMRRQRSLASLNIRLDEASVIKGFVETIEREAKLRQNPARGFSEDQLKSIIYDFERLIQKQEAKIAQLEAAEQRKKNETFYQSYRQQPNAEPLDDNIWVKKLIATEGPKPSIYDKVKIKLKVSLIDGRVIENTGDNTIDLRISQALAGWQKVITAMSKGDKWEAVIPPEMAWGSSRHGNIPANSVLICEFELVAIE